MATRTIYSGRNTNLKYQLLDAGLTKQLDNLTKIELVFSTTLKISGNIGETAPIDFTSDPTVFALKFAGQTLPSGSYPSVKVIVYDGESTSGLVWGSFSLVVKNNPYAS